MATQVVFQSGDTEKTLSFQAVDDSVDDDGESVQLSLGTLPTGVTDREHTTRRSCPSQMTTIRR